MAEPNDGLNFEQALPALKKGRLMRREGWHWLVRNATRYDTMSEDDLLQRLMHRGSDAQRAVDAPLGVLAPAADATRPPTALELLDQELADVERVAFEVVNRLGALTLKLRGPLGDVSEELREAMTLAASDTSEVGCPPRSLLDVLHSRQRKLLILLRNVEEQVSMLEGVI